MTEPGRSGAKLALSELSRSIPGIFVSQSHDISRISVGPANMTKWTAIKQLAQRFSIPPDFVAHLGAGQNDVEALSKAKVSFLMANANSEVKDQVKAKNRKVRVTRSTCENSGSVEALKWLAANIMGEIERR